MSPGIRYVFLRKESRMSECVEHALRCSVTLLSLLTDKNSI